MALSEVWRLQSLVSINDKKIHHKRRMRALFLPQT